MTPDRDAGCGVKGKNATRSHDFCGSRLHLFLKRRYATFAPRRAMDFTITDNTPSHHRVTVFTKFIYPEILESPDDVGDGTVTN